MKLRIARTQGVGRVRAASPTVPAAATGLRIHIDNYINKGCEVRNKY
jgi:hypothetical protein